jgi:hypothetical protein
MSRWKAAGIHLTISGLIGLLVLALLFLVWYPGPYFRAAGGEDLVVILLAVDLVLGPLLTLVLFKSGKKGMRFDLAMIAMFQIAALVYGLHVISEARPAFIVGVVDRFAVVAATDIDDKDLAEGQQPEFRTRSWTGPRLVAIHMPPPGKERTRMMFSATAGKDIENYPKHFVAYGAESASLLKRAHPLSDLRAKKPSDAPVLDAWLAAHARSEDEVMWMPLVARKAVMVMLVDARSGAVIGPLEINPW